MQRRFFFIFNLCVHRARCALEEMAIRTPMQACCPARVVDFIPRGVTGRRRQGGTASMKENRNPPQPYTTDAPWLLEPVWDVTLT